MPSVERYTRHRETQAQKNILALPTHCTNQTDIVQVTQRILTTLPTLVQVTRDLAHQALALPSHPTPLLSCYSPSCLCPYHPTPPGYVPICYVLFLASLILPVPPETFPAAPETFPAASETFLSLWDPSYLYREPSQAFP
jgi:hypothetical protein